MQTVHLRHRPTRAGVHHGAQHHGHRDDDNQLRTTGNPDPDGRLPDVRPLPDDLGHDREGVTVTFFYHVRPEDVEYGGKARPN